MSILSKEIKQFWDKTHEHKNVIPTTQKYKDIKHHKLIEKQAREMAE